MALQSSGQITIKDIADEFGGSEPHTLSEYYDAASGVPSSGMITVSDFYGKSAAISLTITSSQLNFDLYDALIAAGHSSSDISSNTIFNITINSGVTMKGSSTQGNNSQLGSYNYTSGSIGSDHGDSGSGGSGSPERVPWGGGGHGWTRQRAGTSRGALVIEGCPNSATYNIVNNGTFEGGSGMGGHGPWNNHGPWHGEFQHCGGGTGGAPVVMIDQDNCTLNITNNGTMRGAGGGGGGGGWGAGHNHCCPKWGGDGQGHNRSAQGGQGASHGGNAGASGGGWGSGGGSAGQSYGGLGGPLVELRSCSSTSVSVPTAGTQSVNTTTRSTSSWRS